MKIRKTLSILLICLFILYLLAGFLVVPFIVRSQLLKQLPEVLDREVSLGKARFNPLTFSLELHDLVILNRDGTRLASVETFRANLQSSSLILREIRLKEVYLGNPELNVERDAEGNLNFADLLEREATVPEPGQTPRPLPVIRIEDLIVESGDFSFADQSPQSTYRKEARHISFSIGDLTTSPESPGRFEIFAESGKAETVRLSGIMGLNPVRLHGVVIIEALDLPLFMPYLEHLLNGKLDKGMFSLRMAYEVSFTETEPLMRLYDGFIDLEDFALLTHDATEPLLAFQKLALADFSVDLLQQEFRASELTLDGASLFAHLREDGTLNLTTAYLPAPATEATVEESSSSPTGSWSVLLDKIRLEQSAIHFLDSQSAGAPSLSLTMPEFEINGLTNQAGESYELRLSLENSMNGTGLITGKGRIEPVFGSFSLDFSGWDLLPLQPFLSAYAGIGLSGGSLNMSGAGSFFLEESGPTGDLTLDRVELLNPEISVVLVAKEPDTSTGEEKMEEVEEVPVPAVEEAEEEFDLAAFMAEDIPAAPPPSPYHVLIESFSITEGAFSFEDLQQEPSVVFGIDAINSHIQGLSSDPSARPTFTLDAQAMGITPLHLQGQLNFLATEPFVNVNVSLKDLGLNPFAPYFSRYVGYSLEKGLLNLDLAYNLENNALTAENAVLINQLTLGSKTDSPDATGLPVPLALSLLRDPSGNIEVNLPIRGRLDDPEFRFGQVIVRAISTLIVKMASSPFNLLAGLVNVAAEDLETTAFAPGSAELADQSRTQLDALATAMEKRPGIQLEISANIDPAVETPALKKLQLRKQIADEDISDAGEGLSEAEQYQARVTKAFRRQLALSFLRKTLPPFPEMEAELLDDIDIGQNDLRQLADRRMQAVRNYLLAGEGLEAERVMVSESGSTEMAETGTSQVDLSIR